MIPEPLKSLRGHMRKFFVALMASLLSCSAAFAFWPEAMESSFEVGVGYRRDDFKWVTSANVLDATVGGSLFPANVRSELRWKDLDIWQIEGRFKYVTCDNIYIRANGDYGWITHGRNTDRDFLDDSYSFSDSYSGSYSGYSGSEGILPVVPVVGPGGYNYGSEFSNSNSRTRGHVYDASIGIGYQFQLCDCTFAISPLVGYAWYGQHFNLRHGHNGSCGSGSYYSSFFDSESFYSGSINGLRSKYHTRWNGPWIGFDLDYKFWCDWSLYASYDFHWARYHAKARWNLRYDLPDGFHHRVKNAYGHVASVGVKWDFCDCWTLGLNGEFKYFRARHGRDRALVADASAGNVDLQCFTSIPLKKVEWRSASISVDVGMVF